MERLFSEVWSRSGVRTSGVKKRGGVVAGCMVSLREREASCLIARKTGVVRDWRLEVKLLCICVVGVSRLCWDTSDRLVRCVRLESMDAVSTGEDEEKPSKERELSSWSDERKDRL